MIVRYAQISETRRRILRNLEIIGDRFFVAIPWACPLHGLQFVALCHVCGRRHREAHS
jgi:hypothetical protein